MHLFKFSTPSIASTEENTALVEIEWYYSRVVFQAVSFANIVSRRRIK